MRIDYRYTEYKNSKRATDTSHFFNLLLVYIEFALGLCNLFVIFGLGAEVFELLSGVSNVCELSFIFFAILIVVVDYIIVILHFSIDYFCEKIAIEDECVYKKETKESVLESHKQEFIDKLKSFTIQYFVYLPFVLIGVCAVSAAIYGLSNNQLIFNVSFLIVIVDVIAIMSIKRKFSGI